MSDQLERYRWLIAAVLAVPLLVGISVLLNDLLPIPLPQRLLYWGVEHFGVTMRVA